MKQLIFISVIAFVFAADSAFAACTSGTQVTDQTDPTLAQLLSGSIVCVPGCIKQVLPPEPKIPGEEECVIDSAYCKATYGTAGNINTAGNIVWGWDPEWCWQEEHAAGGILSDYKDPNDPNHPEPSKELGTWEVTGTDVNTIVTYNYTEDSPSWTGSFKVYNNNNGTYNFCIQSGGTNNVDAATIRPGTGPCP